MLALTNGWWIWASNIAGASDTNDGGLAEREILVMKNIMEYRVMMIVDRGFHSIHDKIATVVGWKRKRGQIDLPQWQKQENNEVSQQRGIY